MSRQTSETIEHKKLKEAVKDIAKICGFSFDTEIHLNLSGQQIGAEQYADEESMDVVMWGEIKGKKFMLVFECKGGRDLDNINNELSLWDASLTKIKSNSAKVLSSEGGRIKDSDFKKLSEIRVCYVFGNNFDPARYLKISGVFKKRDYYSWDTHALDYYKKISSTVGKLMKYEIFKEFGMNLEFTGTWSEKAIEIKQGDIEMYIFGAYPSVLLRAGYVSRRASGKPEAYQRILNKDRIDKISKFVTTRGALLPNAIIIAFDNEKDVQDKINFTGGYLNFPQAYCSAWIIDGQHRVFGFANTKFEDIYPAEPSEEFKLPVVAFKSLDAVLQNRTFVSINYHQKKIDPTLLCDLATSVPDIQNELTWPSLLVIELNKVAPLKNKVKISELDKKRYISLSSFARYGLLEGLLGYEKKSQQYRGILNTYSPFNNKALLKNKTNQAAFKKQADLLRRYFEGVEHNTKKKDTTKDPWTNAKKYSLLKPAGINALLLALSRIMEKYPQANIDFKNYLKPLKNQSFKRDYVARQGGGWKGFRGLANVMLRKLNQKHKKDFLRLFGKRDKI